MARSTGRAAWHQLSSTLPNCTGGGEARPPPLRTSRTLRCLTRRCCPRTADRESVAERTSRVKTTDPNLPLLEAVANALGRLCDRFVFVGGCATGLLVTDAAASPVRATQDVDVVVE